MSDTEPGVQAVGCLAAGRAERQQRDGSGGNLKQPLTLDQHSDYPLPQIKHMPQGPDITLF